ncbi:MAG: hypothetical protein IKN94_11780 [Salinivirgaceae bacterium]|nr:hypothetical protein [Salinivirgaceae bacterium]
MKTIEKTMIAIALMAMTGTSYAEGEGGVEASVGADVVSSYIWRGGKLDGAAIQPSLSVDYKGLSLGAWGSASIVGSGYKEIDFTLSYAVGGLTAMVTDYWCADDDTKYFEYSADSTVHTYEAGLTYDFGFLSIGWYTNFYGAMGTKANGDDAYSSYFEVAAPFKLGGLDWQAAAGVTPWENDFYGAEGFALINLSLSATKEIEFEKFTLPVFAQITANPTANRMYFLVGLSF